jgi:quercetin dioxygenase-like cupin family protein
VQREGEQVQEIRAGDTVIIPPNVRHWHGAAPDKLFSHLAMSEQSDKGEGTAWFEKVSDSDYTAEPAPVS